MTDARGDGRTLLTGATGFVGKHILRTLLGTGVPVRAVIRKGTATRLGVDSPRLQVVESTDAFAESIDWWQNTCSGIDTVIHAAWYANPRDYLHADANLECLQGSLHLGDAASRSGVRRFIGVGTCFEYDLTAGTIDIDTPLAPATPYAGCKAALYLALANILPRRGVGFAWCRLFYLYGEGEHEGRLVPYLHRQLASGAEALLSSGNQVRDYLDVATAAAFVVDVSRSAVEGPVNVCSGVPVTVRAFAEGIAAHYGLPHLLRFGARPDNAFDPLRVVGVPTPLVGGRFLADVMPQSVPQCTR